MDNVPLSVRPPGHHRAVPARRGFGRAAELRYVRGKVESQHGQVTLPLNLWIHDFNALDPDLANERREIFSERFATVDSLFGHRVEVGFILGHEFEEPFRVTFPPTIKCPTLERDDVFW